MLLVYCTVSSYIVQSLERVKLGVYSPNANPLPVFHHYSFSTLYFQVIGLLIAQLKCRHIEG
jgi:hypothetical protein